MTYTTWWLGCCLTERVVEGVRGVGTRAVACSPREPSFRRLASAARSHSHPPSHHSHLEQLLRRLSQSHSQKPRTYITHPHD